MASIAPNQTVRTVVGHVRHVLFPSRRKLIVGTAIDALAMVLGVPFVAHILLDVVVHVAFVVSRKR